MNLQNIKKLKNEKGFTIVELLIVIVVIGILAAIVIVAYQGVTARANTSTANSAASSIMKKTEAYASEEGGYPAATNLLTPATTTKSYSIAGSGATFVAAYTTKPANPNTLTYYTCGTTLGNKIAYWDYTNNNVAFVYSGSVTASTPAASCTVQTTP